MSEKTKRKHVILWGALGGTLCIAIFIGVIVGFSAASIRNIATLSQFETNDPFLPSKLLDRHGRLITEFFSVEKRELIPIEELPLHLIQALITREDQNFFHHPGFSLRGIMRAAWNVATNQYVSGGSTVTQQLAGTLYADRTEISLSRKFRELWWALQLERNYTKNEILEQYLNKMHFGHGTYGVEAASKFFFGHSSRELTIAESAMLVIQLANPSRYSPIRHPNRAKIIQKTVLDEMTRLGYVSANETELSFSSYWQNYDFTRSNTSTAFFDREIQAGHFTEYVRYQLENELLLGNWNINKDGLTIHSTLDLDYQTYAEDFLHTGITKANKVYENNNKKYAGLQEEITPMINLLSLTFNIAPMYVGAQNEQRAAKKFYRESLNTLVDMMSMFTPLPEKSPLRFAIQHSYQETSQDEKRTRVEGALITLDNKTGHILAMVGGSKFESRNQFNRATDAQAEPGSSFKPLYYSAAIEKGVITPATLLYDSPVIFWNDDGTAYKPENYRGSWKGPVLVREALANSMNVPSLKVLERVGFSDALRIASQLLSIPEEEMPLRNMVHKYPVGLGVVAVSPLEMAKAYATFSRAGKSIAPITIRYVEGRDHTILINPEADTLQQLQDNKSTGYQIISPQTAYIMASMLQSTVTDGTLRYAASLVDGFDHPMAGKTGTTQNWADAWTVGFSPYYTTAVWIGFDRGGTNSLGTNQTGAVTAAPIWSRYMKEIHRNLPTKSFIRPSDISDSWVTAQTGLLPPPEYSGRVINEIFIDGTQPTAFDTTNNFQEEQTKLLVDKLKNTFRNSYDFLDLDPLLSVPDLLQTDGTETTPTENPLLD